MGSMQALPPVTLDCRSGTQTHAVVDGRMRLKHGLLLGGEVPVRCLSCNKRGMVSANGAAIQVAWIESLA